MRGKAEARGVDRGFCLAHDIVGGADLVLRGGSWSYGPASARVAYRVDGAPGYRGLNLGFRLAYDSTKGEQHEKEE
jgi:formylglycine-generating enzyme required for sulfatase activity